MGRKIIDSKGIAPRPIGPYSEAVRASGFLYTCGQLPVDPVTGELVSGDIKAQTRRVLDNLTNLLKCAKYDIKKHAVKMNIYMVNLGDFSDMNEVYKTYFEKEAPARTVVQVVALPKGAMIEMELVAYK